MMSDTIDTFEDVQDVAVEDQESVDDDTVEEIEEEEVEEVVEEEPSLPVPESPKVQKRRSLAPTPGKVKPSEEVKNMAMGSPAQKPKKAGPSLTPGKNPFPSFGSWTHSTMSEIEMVFPVLTGKNESTNELTRANKPEMRYWKAPIVFKYGNYTSTTVRFDNVHIPYHTSSGYGSNFVYLCLPGFAGEAFAQAGKTRRPTVSNEKSLQPDANRWWKVANNVGESFGIISNDTKKFHKKSLETIFDATNSGISATVVLSFTFKANTDSKEPLKPTTQGTISVELERGYISATDVNVQMPVRISSKKKKVEPTAVSKDIASDSLVARLKEFGI